MSSATSSTPANTTAEPPQLLRALGLWEASSIVIGIMIGTAIFIVPAEITREVGSPHAALAVWVVGGLLSLMGALSFAELAAMMPQAGGQYVYLREAYGGLWAFLFGWTLLLVIQTGTIAAVAVAFARFAGVMWPLLGSGLLLKFGSFGLSGERIGAIMVIALLTAANLRGLNMGRLVQNFFTSAKVLSLLLIIAVGCLIAPNLAAARVNFGGMNAFLAHAPLAWYVARASGLVAFGLLLLGERSTVKHSLFR